MTVDADIERRICELIVADLEWNGDSAALLGPDPQKLPEILDSASLLELASIIEGEFDIEIDDEEITPDNFMTVRDLAATVSRKV